MNRENHDPLEMQMLGRRWLRTRFAARQHRSPLYLEAYKIALGQGEIQVGKRLLSSGLEAGKPSESFSGLSRWVKWMAVFGAAAGLAVPLFVFHMMRYGHMSGQKLTLGRNFFGLYPEITSRTKALARQFEHLDLPASVQVIVLGRPKMSIATAGACLSDLFPGKQLTVVYPFQWQNILGCLFRLPVLLQQLVTYSAETGYKPRLGEATASLYRALLGTASDFWSRQVRLETGSRFWMCHTGLADTSLLEVALQDRDVETIHWVHGISDGLNFTGLSSLAIFRCGHDVKWHRSLHGYKKCSYLPPADQVEWIAPRADESDFLLLSNYAHPMNLNYVDYSIRDEGLLLDLFAEAARRMVRGENPARLFWKPHPVFDTLPDSDRSALDAKAGSLGIERVGNKIPLRDLIARCRFIASTQSTVLIDVLSAGGLPVLVALQPMDPDYSLSQTPLQARSAEELWECWANVLSDSVRAKEVFVESHSRLAPGSDSAPNIEEVFQFEQAL